MSGTCTGCRVQGAAGEGTSGADSGNFFGNFDLKEEKRIRIPDNPETEDW